jgi:TP901 family phage tail tape measure protein
MTEMAVVTDLEVGDYWDQLPEHTKRASELGVAIHSVYEAETLYYQQGLKTAEAQELANTTLRMARIAGLDAAEATDKMTAALRGFNMELNEASAEKVADVYSELAAITAADVNEISSAMTKTASIASSAGMEFETTAAFLSQIIETTRESAETAGTAMKTVIARFSEVKKLQGEGLLTGQDEEGEVIDVNKIQTALRTVGISMNEFFNGTEGLDSIFLKLAEKWDTLDVKTQRYIATTAAGSRQQSRFIAMMSDYARTQELVTAANNSAGASQEQFAKTVESLEFKLNQLKNAWNEFSMGILQSDLVKFGVDALTKFLEIINKATSALDGMGGTITKVLTTIALFKLGQKIFEGIKAPMASFFTKLVKDVYGEGIKAG